MITNKKKRNTKIDAKYKKKTRRIIYAFKFCLRQQQQERKMSNTLHTMFFFYSNIIELIIEFE